MLMSFKPINRAIRPDTFRKACCIYPSDSVMPNTSLITNTFACNEILSSTDEYVQALAELMTSKMPMTEVLHVNPYTAINDARYLNSYMFMNYGNRKLYRNYFEWFDVYENSTSEIQYLYNLIMQDIWSCSKANMYKWTNLLKSTLLEFNPLWNVDGVTGEIRETTHTGTDTTSHSGTDTTTHSGDDSTTRTGNEELEYMGSKYNDKTGKEVTTNSGTDINKTSKTTTESNSFYETEKNEMQNGKSSTLSYEGATQGTTYRDTETFNQRKDKRTYNSVKDKVDYNSSNETEFNSSLEKLLNLKDKDLFMQIRQGNIGVTETTTLLTHFREYVNYRVVDIIAKDLINAICEGVY